MHSPALRPRNDIPVAHLLHPGTGAPFLVGGSFVYVEGEVVVGEVRGVREGGGKRGR
jgi:hypothetical protein